MIRIPHYVWIDRSHKKAIENLTGAKILPHDKPNVTCHDPNLEEDCRLIERYIRAMVK